jgi:hypothetical protein
MYALKILVKVLVAFLALSIIVGSVSDDFGAQLRGPERFGLCLATFGSVVLLHFLIWQFIVGDSALLGRDPKSFIDFRGSKTIFSGLTILGYISLALHCLRTAGFLALIEPDVSGNSVKLSYGLAFGLVLIGIGLAARLRLLLQNLQTIPK